MHEFVSVATDFAGYYVGNALSAASFESGAKPGATPRKGGMVNDYQSEPGAYRGRRALITVAHARIRAVARPDPRSPRPAARNRGVPAPLSI